MRFVALRRRLFTILYAALLFITFIIHVMTEDNTTNIKTFCKNAPASLKLTLFFSTILSIAFPKSIGTYYCITTQTAAKTILSAIKNLYFPILFKSFLSTSKLSPFFVFLWFSALLLNLPHLPKMRFRIFRFPCHRGTANNIFHGKLRSFLKDIHAFLFPQCVRYP